MSHPVPPIADLPDVAIGQLSATQRAVIAIHAGSVRYGGVSISRDAAEKIAGDVLGCADTDLFTEAEFHDAAPEEVVEQVRVSLRRELAVLAMSQGYGFTRMPHEIIDQPRDLAPMGLKRIRIIAPARRLSEP